MGEKGGFISAPESKNVVKRTSTIREKRGDGGVSSKKTRKKEYIKAFAKTTAMELPIAVPVN